jgi:hypothetical protein
LRRCKRKGGPQAAGCDRRGQEGDVRSVGGRRPGARQTMGSGIERPAADEVRLEFFSARKTGVGAVVSNPIGHGSYPLSAWRAKSARAPKFRNAKAASLRRCFVPSRRTFSPQYGFRFDYARNRALDRLYALTRIACIEIIRAFHVAAETRYGGFRSNLGDCQNPATEIRLACGPSNPIKDRSHVSNHSRRARP